MARGCLPNNLKPSSWINIFFVFNFLILCKALILLPMFFDKVYDSYFTFLRVWYGISLWLSICILRVLIGNKYSSMNINYREIFLTKINSKIEEPKAGWLCDFHLE